MLRIKHLEFERTSSPLLEESNHSVLQTFQVMGLFYFVSGLVLFLHHQRCIVIRKIVLEYTTNKNRLL